MTAQPDSLRDLFRTHLRIDLNLSTNTIEAYDRDVQDFFGYCKLRKLDAGSAKPRSILEYLMDLRRKELNPATIARRLSTLKHFFKLLSSEGIRPDNPARSIEGPRLMRKLPRILDQAEMEKLLALPDTATLLGLRDRAILELWYACGLRVSEAASLSVDDLMMELRLLRVLGKGGKERMVPFGTYARDALQDYIANGRPKLLRQNVTGTLFLNKLGNKLSRMGLWKILRKYSDQCNFRFNVTPHTIRHSCATHMIEAGADIRTVMEFLGHADISTTQIYTHLDREYLLEIHKTYHPRA